MLAWEMDDRENFQIAANLVSRTFLGVLRSLTKPREKNDNPL